jgi:hypothetical protein
MFLTRVLFIVDDKSHAPSKNTVSIDRHAKVGTGTRAAGAATRRREEDEDEMSEA